MDDEQNQELALSYGPEDAFTLHRYHRPPSNSAGPSCGSVPRSPAQALQPLERPAREIAWLHRPPFRGGQRQRFAVPLLLTSFLE
jgi:hypothetical protein